MCGISGILNINQKPISVELLQRMANSIRHRGPDDEAFLLVNTSTGKIEHRHGDDTIPEIKSVTRHVLDSSDISPNLGFGYRRLSILDLSPSGHQPMSSSDGSHWIEFNGEVYNYLEIREELVKKGYKFKSGSDTEVVLNSYLEWGYDCLNKFNGMWSFVIWDNIKKALFCARDRFGVKPFYYYKDDNKFIFASEIKAILQDSSIIRKLNEPLVYDYFALNLIDHTDETFFNNIIGLPPAHYLILKDSNISIHQYYSLSYDDNYSVFNEEELRKHSNKLKELLFDSIKLRFRSDVPVGSCLSGGLDSSSIVCIGNELLRSNGLDKKDIIGDKQKTFSAVYHDEKVSEKKYVEKIVDKTGVADYYVYPDSDNFGREVDKLIYQQDEPFLSTSMYAQWNVMRLARENGVTVLLDGQGGDEIFAGYEWHLPVFHAELAKKMKLKSYFVELHGISSLRNRSLLKTGINSIVKMIKPAIPLSLRMLDRPQMNIFNQDFIAKYKDREFLFQKSDSNLQKRLYEEETKYNLRQLLRYEDRNSMAFSIEARVPFIDYRLVEYALSIPTVYKIHNGWTKYILRSAMNGILPESIQWRKDKMGFVTPEKQWLSNINWNDLIGDVKNNPVFETLLSKPFLRKNNFSDMRESPLSWKLVNLISWLKIYNVS